MDRESWWAAVRRAVKSWTGLKSLSMHAQCKLRLLVLDLSSFVINVLNAINFPFCTAFSVHDKF